MTNRNRRQDSGNQNRDHDALDSELDGAMATFAAVEPRAGLEERVLASLWSQKEQRLAPTFWHWPALFVPAALVILAAISFVWRLGRHTPAATSRQPPSAQHDQSKLRAAADSIGSPVHRSVPATPSGLPTRRVGRPREAVASAPKLDQFPSPQPLNEQENILVSYVAKFQDHAALVARARMESLRQELTDEASDAIDHETGN